MLSGHYAVGLGLKAVDRSVPLWVLFVGAQIVDIAFLVFVLLDVEHLRIIPGFTKVYPLDMYHFPYSHGLIMVPFWCAIAVLLYGVMKRLTLRSIVVVSIAVSSHWFLDFLVHPKDLPLVYGSVKVGLSLWNLPVVSVLVESVLVVVAILCFLKVNVNHNLDDNRKIYYSFGCTILIVLVLINIVMPFYPTPKSTLEVCIVGLLTFAVFPAWAYYFEYKTK